MMVSRTACILLCGALLSISGHLLPEKGYTDLMPSNSLSGNVFLPLDTRSASSEICEEQPSLSEEQPSRGGEVRTMRATAYDLSIQCCGKGLEHPGRGITAGGKNLSGLSRKEAMTIASIDYPLGTELLISFPEPYTHYDGVYAVQDTGGFRSGTIDVFVGDYGDAVSQEAISFGVRTVQVQVKEERGREGKKA